MSSNVHLPLNVIYISYPLALSRCFSHFLVSQFLIFRLSQVLSLLCSVLPPPPPPYRRSLPSDHAVPVQEPKQSLCEHQGEDGSHTHTLSSTPKNRAACLVLGHASGPFEILAVKLSSGFMKTIISKTETIIKLFLAPRQTWFSSYNASILSLDFYIALPTW